MIINTTNDLLKYIEAYGNCDYRNLLIHSYDKLSTWMKMLKSLPYDIINEKSKYGRLIRSSTTMIGNAMRSKRDMITTKRNTDARVMSKSSANTKNALTKEDIDKSVVDAYYLLKRDGWVTRDGKICYGERPPFRTLEDYLKNSKRHKWEVEKDQLNNQLMILRNQLIVLNAKYENYVIRMTDYREQHTEVTNFSKDINYRRMSSNCSNYKIKVARKKELIAKQEEKIKEHESKGY